MKHLILIISCIASMSVNAQLSSESYEHPFTPNDAKWNEYISPDQRILALQIPESILSDIPTDRLLELCLDFPYLTDMLFSESITEGMNNLFKEFNGYGELLKRNDLFVYAKKQCVELLENEDLLHSDDNLLSGRLSFKLFVAENLLMKAYIAFRDSEELKDYLDIRKIVEDECEDSLGGLCSVSLAYLKTLLNDNHENVRMNSRNSSSTWEPVTIYTPNMSVVPDTYSFIGNDISYTSSQLAALETDLYQNYNGAQMIGPPTERYNCHGYAWHKSEGGNSVWIGLETTTAEDVYWEDDSYFQTTEQLATKVSYAGNHSAVRLDSVWCQSKWGYGPLVKHHLNDVPSSYNPSSPKLFYVRPTMMGPNSFCNNAIYRINNLPTSATVNWYVDNYMTLVSGQGTSIAYIAKAYDGLGSLIAQIRRDGQIMTTVSKQNIGVGTVDLALSVYPTDPFGNNGTWNFNYHPNGFIVDSVINQFYSYYQVYLYKKSGNTWQQVYYNSYALNGAHFVYSGSNGWYKMKIRGYNSCGFSDWWELEVLTSDLEMDAIPDLSLSYNPSTDVLDVSLNDKQNIPGVENKEDASCIIQLWNSSRILKTTKSIRGKSQISMTGLPNGTYFVKALKNRRLYGTKFVKNK